MPETASKRPLLVLATESTFVRLPDGRIGSTDGSGTPYWSWLLDGFDRVHLVARVHEDAVPGQPWGPPSGGPAVSSVVDGPVRVLPLPGYARLSGFVRSLPGLLGAVWQASGTEGAVLLRLPGAVGTLFGLCLLLRRRAFSVQLVGDVDDVLRGEAFTAAERLTRMPLRWLTQFLCRRASSVGYVTQTTLQRRYPARPGTAVFAFSNVQLRDSDVVDEPDAVRVNRLPLRVLFCGSLEQMYKGLDVLIAAVAQLRAAHVGVRLRVVGQGRYRDALERMATDAGIGGQVEFLGQLPRAGVLDEMKQASLFVLPSRTEGLPRALIEAMACGVPCIGSRVGGIVELLDEAAMVPADDSERLARLMARVANDEAFCMAQVRRNLQVAARFTTAVLDVERARFLRSIP